MEVITRPRKKRLAKKELGPAWATDEFFYEAIQEFKLQSLFFTETVQEVINFRIRQGFHTACWTFKNGQHYVFLGTGILRSKSPHVALLTPDTGKEYLLKFLAHEYAHALYTVRKAESFVRRLKRAGIPFSLWNLFEDCRIEDFKRNRNNFSFEWLNFETLPSRVSPTSLFFSIIQAEGDIAKVRDELDKKGDTYGTSLLSRVRSYSDRALKCLGSTDLYPLLKEWLAEFPAPPDADDAPGDGLQDLALSYELMSNAAQFDAFLEESIDADEPLESVEDAPEAPPGLQNLTPDMKERSFNSYDFIERCPADQHGVDWTRVSQIAETLKKVLSDTRSKRFSEVPSKRFNARRDLLGLSPYRHDPKDPRPFLNVMLFVDCSGSMKGFPMKEAKILLAALSLLAQRNRLAGYLVLSASSTARSTHHHRFKFPLSAKELENIHSQMGGEGLEAAMMDPSNLALAAKASKVYVITDAEISDNPISKVTLNQRGISTTGIYVGKSGNPAKMDMYFDSFLIRNSIEEIVQALLETLK